MSEKQVTSRKKLTENISSETLFTFTGKLGYLTDMLNVGIKPRFVYEPLPYKDYYYITPVKCFCDIPLGKIKSHLEWFGNYGLGINRKFLQDNGTTPVMYVHENSDRIIKTISGLRFEELINMPSLPLLKRHFGWDYKKDLDGTYIKKQRKFYDEREWRYVPSNSPIFVGDGLTIENGINYSIEMNNNNQLNNNPLELVPSIIEYIIIYDKSELPNLIKSLKEIYDDSVLDEMLTKVLIAKQILKDF